MEFRYIAAIIVFVVLTVFITWIYFREHPFKKGASPRLLAASAMFGALSAILYAVPVFNFSLPIFPSFLSLHIDEVPLFIAGFAYGPWAAILATIVKTVVKLPLSSTAFVGELGDLIMSLMFVLPATLIYQKKRNLKGVAIGFAVSTVLQVISAMLLNVYVLVPFYATAMAGLDEATLLAICQLAMPWITDVKWSYALYAVLPFNLLKDAIVIVLTFIVYHFLHRFIKPEK